MVAVVGEAGVGKSRLFYEFTHSHRSQNWLILESSSASYAKATAYLPVIDLLKAYFQIEGRDDARKLREKVSGKLVTLDQTLMPQRGQPCSRGHQGRARPAGESYSAAPAWSRMT